MRSRSSRRMLPTKRSAIALARGARTGVLMMRTPIAVKTASKAAVNLASRSRIRNWNWRPASSRSKSRLQAADLVRLREAYWAIRPQAAPGVDGVTWAEYGQDLEANLRDLHARVQAGRYRAKPSRRVYIPKADGRQRPLGIASLEDKIVQRAVVEVLNAVYEVDFRGFSYGFRPGRGPHDALDALAVGIERKRVNWVLDADIRNFFLIILGCEGLSSIGSQTSGSGG